MPSEDRAPYRLSLCGPWKLHGPDGREVRSILAQPRRLCLLAYLALRAEPVSRSTLVAVFWPDSDEERARNALSQSLHYLRRSLGPGVVENVEGDRVRVSADRLWFDARELLAAPEPGRDRGVGDDADRADRDARWARAVGTAERIRGGREFFQGWNADDAQPLQSWLDEVRRRVAERAMEVGRTASSAASTESKRKTGADDGGETAGEDRRSRAMWIGGGALIGTALIILVLTTRVGSADPGASVPPSAPDEPAEIAVLLPRVTVLGSDPAVPSGVLAEAIHDEMMVRLGPSEDPRVFSVKFESEVAQLVRSLEAQGTIDPAQGRIDPPDWVVSVSVRTGGGQARVIGLLLRGPDYTTAVAVSEHDYTMSPDEAVLIELPKRIAGDLVEELVGSVWVEGSR